VNNHLSNIVANIDKYFKRHSYVIDEFCIFFMHVFSKCKNIDSMLEVVDVVIELRMSQRDILVVIEEETFINIVEFVVAIFKESILYVRILTTFVEMIDVEIEIKVEVNFENHKSLIKRYFSSIACLNDLETF